MRNVTIFVLFIVVMLLSSCCKSNLIESYNFSDSDGLIVPYTGLESIKFIDDSNNTVSYGNGYRKIIQEEMDQCDGGCCDYYLVERYDLTYFESNFMESNLQVSITNNFNVNMGAPISPPTISFRWDYYEIGPYVTSTWFNSLPVVNMNKVAIDRGMFLDSLTLYNTMYYKIYTFKGETAYPERLYVDSLFYSESEGVVGMKFSNGNLWTIYK